MKRKLLLCARRQDGFTLVEVIITSLLTLIVMTGLTSVVLTAMRGNEVASGRIEASGQIRNFELRAYDDFALSSLPSHPGCPATQASPCSTPIVLAGKQVANSAVPAPAPYDYQVTYSWDGTAADCGGLPAPCLLDRLVPGNSSQLAASVTCPPPCPPAFSWYLSGGTVVITLTVTVRSYTETQTLLFYPRVS